MSLRNTSSKILSVLSGLLGVVNGSTTDAQSFADCGVLVQGVECVLFAADSGGEYLLDTHGAFQVGDGVFVTGGLIPGCITTCLQSGMATRETTKLCRDPTSPFEQGGDSVDPWKELRSGFA